MFYGDQPTPLQFMAGCERLRYYPGDDSDTRIVDILTGETHAPIGLPSAAAAHADRRPARRRRAWSSPSPTDPRWGNDLMKTGNTAIRSWAARDLDRHGLQLLRRRHRPRPPQRLRRRSGRRALLGAGARRCAADKTPAGSWNGQARWADLEASLRAGHPVIVGMRGGPAGSYRGGHVWRRRPGRQLQDRGFWDVDLQDAGRLHQPEEGLHPDLAGRLRGRAAAVRRPSPSPSRAQSPSSTRPTAASTTRRSRCASRSTPSRASRSRAPSRTARSSATKAHTP